MAERLLPLPLLQNCGTLVRAHHAKHGTRGLTAHLATRRNMVALLSMPDTLALSLESKRIWSFRIVLWLALLGTAILALLHRPLWLLANLAILAGERLLSKRMSQRDMYFASTLLGMEWLVHDFAGWGAAFPDPRSKATALLNDPGAPSSTEWLDYYLPNRRELPPELLQSLGPK